VASIIPGTRVLPELHVNTSYAETDLLGKLQPNGKARLIESSNGCSHQFPRRGTVVSRSCINEFSLIKRLRDQARHCPAIAEPSGDYACAPL
jgi:hypothetical protein